MIERVCQTCGKTFEIAERRLKHGRGKFCSRDCFHASTVSKNKVLRVCEVCGENFNCWPRTVRLGRGKYCSRTCYGKYISLNQSGENSHSWRGGLTPAATKFRNSQPYITWRDSVYARDNWTCQDCGVRGGILNAHHIFQFADFPEHRLELWNGITLCDSCHSKAHPNINLNAKTNMEIR